MHPMRGRVPTMRNCDRDGRRVCGLLDLKLTACLSIRAVYRPNDCAHIRPRVCQANRRVTPAGPTFGSLFQPFPDRASRIARLRLLQQNQRDRMRCRYSGPPVCPCRRVLPGLRLCAVTHRLRKAPLLRHRLAGHHRNTQKRQHLKSVQKIRTHSRKTRVTQAGSPGRPAAAFKT